MLVPPPIERTHTKDDNLVDDSSDVIKDFDENRDDDVEIVHDDVGGVQHLQLGGRVTWPDYPALGLVL